MKKILFSLALFITNMLFAQNLQNANWCFGTHAGVNFNITPPTPFWSAMNAQQNAIWYEGAGQASVSEENGVLQFYTDGLTVWNGNHQVLTNGTGLFGYSELPGFQKVVIIPKPKQPNIYYVFTLGLIYSSPVTALPPLGNGGIHYSVIDMTPGNERVVSGLKNISVNNHNGVAVDYPLSYFTSPASPVYITQHSRMTTSLHADGDKIWLSLVVDFDQNNAQVHNRYFYNYLVTENGIVDGITGSIVPDGVSPAPLVSTLLNNLDYPLTPWIAGQYWGAMKVSPDGTLLGDSENGAVNLYGYNNLTGNIGPPPPPLNQHVYITPIPYFTGSGLEFSPDSKLIYFSDTNNGILQGPVAPARSPLTEDEELFATLYQYDTRTDSLRIIHRFSITPSDKNIVIPIDPLAKPFGLQLGLDNRIYVCNYAQVISQHDRLGVIQFPNTVGTGCAFDPDGLILTPNTYHNQSLPQWVHTAAVAAIWPKIYEFHNPETPISALGRYICGNPLTGNIYTFETADFTNNINHIGALPSTPGSFLINYSTNTSAANWLFPNEKVGFILNNGNLQTILPNISFPINYITLFRDGITGAIVSGPALVPSNEVILAEDNGTYITTTGNDLRVRSFLGTSIIPFPPGGYYFPFQNIYNPVTKNLFVKFGVSPGPDAIVVYNLMNNTLNNIHTFIPPSSFDIFQVNTNDQIFLSSNGNIYSYDYITNNYVLYNIIGLNNNGTITRIEGSNSYVSDELMGFNRNDQYIYYINTSTNLLKKISYTAPCNNTCLWIYYHKDINDNVYLLGEMEGGNSATIGNQTYEFPNPNVNPVFLAKFNIQIDFSFRPPGENSVVSATESLKTISSSALQNRKDETVTVADIEATLSPNPAKNSLVISLKQKGKETASSFVISITNALGVNVLTLRTVQNIFTVDLSRFITGIYYVTISTDKGDKTTLKFIKE